MPEWTSREQLRDWHRLTTGWRRIDMGARIVRHVLPDFSAEKIAQQEVLIDLLEGLGDTDLIRVIGTAFHAGVDRWPGKTLEQWVAASRQAVDETHAEGFG